MCAFRPSRWSQAGGGGDADLHLDPTPFRLDVSVPPLAADDIRDLATPTPSRLRGSAVYECNVTHTLVAWAAADKSWAAADQVYLTVCSV